MFFNQQNCGFPFQMPNMNGQMPFPFPFFNQQPKPEQPPVEGEEPKAPQGFNPFAGWQMPQGFNPFAGWQMPQGFNPFAGWQMPQMQMPPMPTPEQIQEWLDNLFAFIYQKGDAKSNPLPFGIPVQFLQVLLNLDSTPNGLSKFQKILDMVFDAYSKAKAPEAPAEAPAPAEEE